MLLPEWHSIWVNLNPTRANAIVSYAEGAWQQLHGEEKALLERFASGASFVLPPHVFRQANLDGFDRIVGALREAVPDGARVVEWYAGVGSLGLSVAPSAAWVRWCSSWGTGRMGPIWTATAIPLRTLGRASCLSGRSSQSA